MSHINNGDCCVARLEKYETPEIGNCELVPGRVLCESVNGGSLSDYTEGVSL